ncbi:MAG: segregation/condensation protein A [Clostridia bacterium]|nr:segregation/condensation protein A [Clostridia bacterium]
MEELTYKTEEFEGPLDLLLYLISKNKLDIFDICIEELVSQYLRQIENIKSNNMELSSEFVQMAARLIYLKTISLLPKNPEAKTLKEELQGQLVEYQKCKQAAKTFSKIISFDRFCRAVTVLEKDNKYTAKIEMSDILQSYKNILLADKQTRADDDVAESLSHIVKRPIISVKSKEIAILNAMYDNRKLNYKSLFCDSRTRSDLVATFLALLELVKENRISIVYDKCCVKDPVLVLNLGGEKFEQ